MLPNLILNGYNIENLVPYGLNSTAGEGNLIKFKLCLSQFQNGEPPGNSLTKL